MIMPLDIQNKKFAKAVRGYKEEEVDQFLDMVTVDYEKILDDNRLLKLKISDLENELDKKKAVEASVVEALASTKSLMHDISESSEKRAQILLRNAQLDAQLIVREAKETAENLKLETIGLKTRLDSFNARYKELLESELNKFDVMQNELLLDAQESQVYEAANGQATGDEFIQMSEMSESTETLVDNDADSDDKNEDTADTKAEADGEENTVL